MTILSICEMLYDFGHAFVHETEYALEHRPEAAVFKLVLTLELDCAKEALKQHLWIVTQNNETRVHRATHRCNITVGKKEVTKSLAINAHCFVRAKSCKNPLGGYTLQIL